MWTVDKSKDGMRNTEWGEAETECRMGRGGGGTGRRGGRNRESQSIQHGDDVEWGLGELDRGGTGVGPG